MPQGPPDLRGPPCVAGSAGAVVTPLSALFITSDSPVNIMYLIMTINANTSLLDSGWYAAVFISFLYFCANPFIYAIKFEPVKRVLLSLISCMKTTVQPFDAVEMAGSQSAKGTGQSRK